MKKYIVILLVLCFCIISAQDNNPIDTKSEQKQKVKRVDKWFAVDKAQHFTYSCLISLGCQYVLVNKSKNTESESLPVSTALSFVAGLSKELNDSRGKNGFFSVKDMIANCAGLLVAAAIISS
ncbi:hypothetical protein OAV77_00970 [Candidatus Marinimicrobia bacterium]|mgnify:FL=1|jgi:uncharacterized protein YfiM (DUF2279 family)|nr:hypothetical protein [Candidatus Neomarinimicrobiota bacterium]MDC3333655.1 hypothetical protein [Candidatus Neomarinimicrobiota bacterium]|tara:strand:- start:6515 stop:6883 length:369 start_codon:yes stop_codon:yes gene_type:complete